jgi:hypothetical protein
VIHFETLREDFNVVCKQFDLPISGDLLKKINVGVDHNDFRASLREDAQVRAIVGPHR